MVGYNQPGGVLKLATVQPAWGATGTTRWAECDYSQTHLEADGGLRGEDLVRSSVCVGQRPSTQHLCVCGQDAHHMGAWVHGQGVHHTGKEVC